jgi:glycosyltransferase involved in cell wall biosynthesis
MQERNPDRLIGVDATCWNNIRGYGRHARCLLKSLVRLDTKSRYTLFVDSPLAMDDLPAEAEVCRVNCSAPTVVAASSSSHRSVKDMWRVSRAMSDSRFDLLLFPTIYSYVPVFSRAKKVVFIHDIIAERFPKLTIPRLSSRLLWTAKAAVGRWQADALVTVSEYSRRGIATRFKIGCERISVVGEASDPIFRLIDNPIPTPLLESLGIEKGGRYLVYVGGFGPHKNLKELISAFSRLAHTAELRDVLLIMVGEYRKEAFHSHFDAIEKHAIALGIRHRVIFTGYLPDEDLVILLNLAAVLVLPSLIEGFGLPAIEAAACGCPVIATSASPLPDMLGLGGEYHDPNKPEELVNAIARLFTSEDLRQKRRKFGLEAAQRLTWDAAARQMMTVFQSLIPV